MCQSVNLSWNRAAPNAGCVFAYSCDEQNNNLQNRIL